MKALLLPLLLFSLEYCQAQTMVGGTISSNTTWYPSGNPYIVTDIITINENVTLNIQPGVIVKFEKGVPVRYNIIVDGTLRAIGTEDSVITFTSNEFIPNMGDWGAFIFHESAEDYDFNNQTGCILQYCNMEYGGSYFLNIWGNVTIVMQGTSAYIDHCVITKAATNEAIYAFGCASEIKITNNKFMSMGGNVPDLIYFLEDSSAEVSCNLFYKNDGYPAYSEGHLNFHNNIVVNHSETGFDIAPLNNFDHNTIVDNQTDEIDHQLINLRGSMDHNTITRNILPNVFGGRSCITVADTNAKINYNNIYDQLPESNPFYEVGTYLQRQSYITGPVDAMNNWFKKYSLPEIDQIIYDYQDDTAFYLINFEPYLSSPDIDAPITPPTGVTKTDLGGNNVLVTWNPNPDADLAGYKIYWGNPTGYSFSNSIDVGNVTSYTLTNFFFNDTLAVTAYDTGASGAYDQCEGHESWFTSDYLFTGISSALPPLNHLRCYPNPADQYTVLDISDQGKQNEQLVIRSSIGEVVKTLKLDSRQKQTIQLSDLPSGIYEVSLLNENGKIGFLKLAVVR